MNHGAVAAVDGPGLTSEARFMDKRQLRQSAVADFMESLEQLNELWDNDTEPAVWEESAKTADADRASRRSASSTNNASAKNTYPESNTR